MKKNQQTEDIRVSQTSHEEVVRENTTEFPTVKEETPTFGKHEKKKNALFRRERKEKAQEPQLVFPISENEEDMRVYQADALSQGNGLDDTLELAAEEPTQPIPELGDTHVLNEEDKEEEKSTQLLWEGFEEDSSAREDAMAREERLRRVRSEQIKDFSQRREMHILEEDAESSMNNVSNDDISDERGDVVYPETPLEKEQEKPTMQREAPSTVIERLRQQLRHCNTGFFFSIITELILFFLTLLSAFSPVLAMGPVAYLIIQLLLFGILCIANFSALTNGFARLFTGKATPVSGVSLSVLLTLMHTALQFLNTTDLSNGTTPLLTAIAGLGVLLVSLSTRLEIERTLRNAPFVLSTETEKTVYKRIESPSLAEEIGRPAVALGEPRVAYYRETKLVDRYAELSDDSDVCIRQMKWYLPTVLAVSLLVSIAFFVINGISSWLVTITLFCAMVSVSAPALLPFSLQVAISGASRLSESEGTVMTGYQAVKQYGSVHALALDATDIFPEQCVLLHAIKTFSGTRIDDAILDAASVSVRAGGPLSFVFRRMIQNKVDMLREVDTLVYEQDMGLSGWVSGRRVLIGNRKLLDNHGIDIPSKDYEQRYAVNGRQLIYLSIAGELSAMFVVSYIADEHIKTMLTALTKQHVTLLVRTCDQNITERLIATVYDLNGFYVELLGAPAGRSFEGLVDGVSECQESPLISTGKRTGLVLALALCSRLKKGIGFFAILQTVLSVALMLSIAYTVFFVGGVVSPLYLADILLGASLVFAAIAFFFGKK